MRSGNELIQPSVFITDLTDPTAIERLPFSTAYNATGSTNMTLEPGTNYVFETLVSWDRTGGGSLDGDSFLYSERYALIDRSRFRTVPAPSTALLLASGLAVGGRRRRVAP